jgi:hypothetical protein
VWWFFESTDLVAQRFGGDVQFLCRLGQAEMPCRGLEGAQGIERWHRMAHDDFSIIN